MKNKIILSIIALAISLVLPIKASASGKISVTFDDGNGSTYEYALPILSKYQIPATVFIVTNDVGDEGMLTWREIQTLQNTYGWEIGSHSATHPEMSQLTDKQITDELTKSLKALSTRKINVTSFATPYGDYDNRVLSESLKYYNLHRGFWERGYFNTYPYDRGTISVQSVQTGTTLEEVKSWIDKANAENSWLVLVFHEILPEYDDFEYTNTTEDLENIAKYINESGISVVLPNHTLQKPSANMVVNPTFNSGLGNWIASNTSINLDTSNKGSYPDPTNSVKLTGNASLSSLLTDKINVIPNAEYIFEVFTNASSLTAGELGFYVDEYDFAGNWVSGKWLGLISNGAIRYFTKVYTPTSSLVSKVSLQTYLTAGSNGSAYIDNVSMYNQTPDVTPTPIANYVLNPDFEITDANGWATNWRTDSNIFNIDNTSSGGSGNSIHLSANASRSHLFSDLIQIDSASTYLWNSYIKATGSGEFGFYIDEYDSSGNWISGQWKGMINNTHDGFVGLSYTPTSQLVASINLQYYILENGSFELYLDNVTFTK